VERRSNVVNLKWWFSWEVGCGRGGIGTGSHFSIDARLAILPKALAASERQHHPAIVFLLGKWFTEQGPSGDTRCVLIKVIYSLSFEAV